MERKGLVISFMGLPNSGKTTLASLTHALIKERYGDADLIKYPTYFDLRKMLNNSAMYPEFTNYIPEKKGGVISDSYKKMFREENLLKLEDELQTYEELLQSTIIPSLAKSHIIVMDDSPESLIAYRLYGINDETQLIQKYQKNIETYKQMIGEHKIFLLDASLDTVKKREQVKKEVGLIEHIPITEKKYDNLFKKVSLGYKDMTLNNHDSIYIDSNKEMGVVFSTVYKQVNKLLNQVYQPKLL